MKLLILSEASGLLREQGLCFALAEQFQQHREAVVWLSPDQIAAREFPDLDESVLVIDCLGTQGKPDTAFCASDSFNALLDYCEERQWVWLSLSDSRVFPANAKRRFVEVDSPEPSTAGGRQLLMHENAIADRVERHIILRVGPVIAGAGDNLLTRLLIHMRKGGVVTLPEAQRFCPTPIADVARVIAAMHDQLDCGACCWGTFHYESADPASGYEFAEVVLAAATQYWPIDDGPVQLRSAQAESAADVYPLLNCQRIRDTFGIQQLPWRRAIPVLLREIQAHHSAEMSSS
ncbi:MAG: sugar nucleotide-binding protein [Spongiibacteraceae bacterium]